MIWAAGTGLALLALVLVTRTVRRARWRAFCQRMEAARPPEDRYPMWGERMEAWAHAFAGGEDVPRSYLRRWDMRLCDYIDGVYSTSVAADVIANRVWQHQQYREVLLVVHRGYWDTFTHQEVRGRRPVIY